MAKVLPYMRCLLKKPPQDSSCFLANANVSLEVGGTFEDSTMCDDGPCDPHPVGSEQLGGASSNRRSNPVASMSPSCPVCRERVFPESEVFPEACSLCRSYVHLKCDPDAGPLSEEAEARPRSAGDGYVCKVCKSGGEAEVARDDDVIEDPVPADDDADVDLDLSHDSWSVTSPPLKPEVAENSPPSEVVADPIPSELSKSSKKIGRSSELKQPKKKSKYGPYVRKERKVHPEIRGIFGNPAISLEGPAVDDLGGKERGKVMMVCSTKDAAAVSFDLCAICGSIGQGQEGRLIPCVQCGQAYHPYCLKVKLTPGMINNGWRCPTCAFCEKCGKQDAGEGVDSSFVFCEDCRLPVHRVCLNPARPPSGLEHLPWKCRTCAVCDKCSKPHASSGDITGNWGTSFVCGRCSSTVECRACGQFYEEEELIVKCPACERWMHALCDKIQSEEEAEECSKLGYACPDCRPADDLPPHLNPVPCSPEMAEESVDPNPHLLVENPGTTSDEKPPASLPPLVVRFKRDILGQSFELASVSGAAPAPASTPESRKHYLDGVDLSESGAKAIKELIKAHSDGAKGKRVNKKKSGDGETVVQMEQAPETGIAETTPAKKGTSEAALKRKQRALQRSGIGGFLVKAPRGRKPAEVPSGGESSKKQRRRKVKSKLLECMPAPMQEAFFGRKTLDSARESDAMDLGENVDDSSPAVGEKGVSFSKEDLNMIDKMKQERENRQLRVQETKEQKAIEKQKRREQRLQKTKERQELKRRKKQPVQSASDTIAELVANSSVLDVVDGDLQGESWNDVLFSSDLLSDVMMDSLLEAEMEDGQLGFDDFVTGKDESIRLDENALGACSVADSGISESGPDSTPHASHAKDEFTDFLLRESFDENLPTVDTRDVENVFNGVMGDEVVMTSIPDPGPAIAPVDNCQPVSVPVDFSYSFDESTGIASVLSSNSQESGQFESYSFSSQNSVTSAAPTPTPVATLGSTKKEPKPIAKTFAKWESEECLGDKATIAPMLFANTCRPDFVERYPSWTERQKQIGKAWRSLSVEERNEFVRKARDNRAATKASASKSSKCSTPGPQTPSPAVTTSLGSNANPGPSSWQTPPPPPPLARTQQAHAAAEPSEYDYDPTLDMVMSKQKQLRDFLHNQQQQQYEEEWKYNVTNEVTESPNHSNAVFRSPVPQTTRTLYHNQPPNQQFHTPQHAMAVRPPPPYEQVAVASNNGGYPSTANDAQSSNQNGVQHRRPSLLDDLVEQEKQEQYQFGGDSVAPQQQVPGPAMASPMHVPQQPSPAGGNFHRGSVHGDAGCGLGWPGQHRRFPFPPHLSHLNYRPPLPPPPPPPHPYHNQHHHHLHHHHQQQFFHRHGYPVPCSYRPYFARHPQFQDAPAPFGHPISDAARPASASSSGIQAPAPATPCAVSPMSPPPTPPKSITTDEDMEKKRKYEEWLTQNAKILGMRQAHFQAEVDRFRKVRRTILAKQRTLKKSGQELAPPDAATLEKITVEQAELQKQLDQCRKAMKQHSTLLSDYSAKHGPLAPPPVQDAQPVPQQQQQQQPPQPAAVQVHPGHVAAPGNPVECCPPSDHQVQHHGYGQPRFVSHHQHHGMCGPYVAQSPLQSPVPMTPSPGSTSYHHAYSSPQQASVPPMVSPGIPYLTDDSAAGMYSVVQNGQVCLPPQVSPGYSQQGMHPSQGYAHGSGSGYSIHSGHMTPSRMGSHGGGPMASPRAHYYGNGYVHQGTPYGNGHHVTISTSNAHHPQQFQQQSPHYGEQPPPLTPTRLQPMHQTPPQMQAESSSPSVCPSMTTTFQPSSCGMEYNEDNKYAVRAQIEQMQQQQERRAAQQQAAMPQPQAAGGSGSSDNRGGGNPNHPFLPCLRIFGGNFKLGLRGGSPLSPAALAALAKAKASASPGNTPPPAEPNEADLELDGAASEEAGEAVQESQGDAVDPDSSSSVADPATIEVAEANEEEGAEESGVSPQVELVTAESGDKGSQPMDMAPEAEAVEVGGGADENPEADNTAQSATREEESTSADETTTTKDPQVEEPASGAVDEDAAHEPWELLAENVASSEPPAPGSEALEPEPFDKALEAFEDGPGGFVGMDEQAATEVVDVNEGEATHDEQETVVTVDGGSASEVHEEAEIEQQASVTSNVPAEDDKMETNPGQAAGADNGDGSLAEMDDVLTSAPPVEDIEMDVQEAVGPHEAISEGNNPEDPGTAALQESQQVSTATVKNQLEDETPSLPPAVMAVAPAECMDHGETISSSSLVEEAPPHDITNINVLSEPSSSTFRPTEFQRVSVPVSRPDPISSVPSMLHEKLQCPGKEERPAFSANASILGAALTSGQAQRPDTPTSLPQLMKALTEKRENKKDRRQSGSQLAAMLEGVGEGKSEVDVFGPLMKPSGATQSGRGMYCPPPGRSSPHLASAVPSPMKASPSPVPTTPTPPPAPVATPPPQPAPRSSDFQNVLLKQLLQSNSPTPSSDAPTLGLPMAPSPVMSSAPSLASVLAAPPMMSAPQPPTLTSTASVAVSKAPFLVPQAMQQPSVAPSAPNVPSSVGIIASQSPNTVPVSAGAATQLSPIAFQCPQVPRIVHGSGMTPPRPPSAAGFVPPPGVSVQPVEVATSVTPAISQPIVSTGLPSGQQQLVHQQQQDLPGPPSIAAVVPPSLPSPAEAAGLLDPTKLLSSSIDPSAAASALLASALSQDPSLIKHEPPPMTTQAAILEAEKILKMAGIKTEREEPSVVCAEGSAASNDGSVSQSSDGPSCASAASGTESVDGTNETALSEAELKKQQELEARRAKRRLYQKKRRMMENERKALAKAAAENGGLPPPLSQGLLPPAAPPPPPPPPPGNEPRPGTQKGVKRPAGAGNAVAGPATVAAPSGFSPGRATPVSGVGVTVPVGTVSPSGAPPKKKSRKQSTKVEAEVDYDGFLETIMQRLRGLTPLALGEPQIPPDVSDPVLPPTAEAKSVDSKKIGQMLSNREERYDWLSTTGRLVGGYGDAALPNEFDYYEQLLKGKGSQDQTVASASANEQHLKYYSLEFGPKEKNPDGSLKLDPSLITRSFHKDVSTARGTSQSMGSSRSSMFSPTGSRRRSLDSPDSFVSTSSPEHHVFSDEDEDSGPRLFYPGLWDPEEEGEEGEELAKRRKRFATGGKSPVYDMIAPIPVRGDELPGVGDDTAAHEPIARRQKASEAASVVDRPQETNDDKENHPVEAATEHPMMPPILAPPSPLPPHIPLRENNTIAVTLTLSAERVKEVDAVLGKLSFMLGLTTPLTYDIEEVRTPEDMEDVGCEHGQVAASGACTPMELGEGARDGDSVSFSSSAKEGPSSSSVSTGSLDCDRYCKHCDVLIGVGTNEVRKSAKDFGPPIVDEENVDKEDYVFCSTNCYMQFALIKGVSGDLSGKDVDIKSEPKEEDEEELKREIEVLGLGGVGRPEVKPDDGEMVDIKPICLEEPVPMELEESSLLSASDGGNTASTSAPSDLPVVGPAADHEPEDMLVEETSQLDQPESPGTTLPTFRMKVAPNDTRSFLLGLPETVPPELRERLEWLKDPRPTPSPESVNAEEDEVDDTLVSEEESDEAGETEAGGPGGSGQGGKKGKGNVDKDGKGSRAVAGGAVSDADAEDEAGASAPPKEKKSLKGIAYKYFDFDDLPVAKKNRPPTENELTDMLFRMGICLMPTWDSLDQRECAFCGVPGDGSSDGPARLLNLGVDKWVHLNCALWTDDVYETTSGALVNVDQKLKENARFTCTLCERPGASVHCFKLRCTNYYHLGCAAKAGCVFYKNKTVFCQQHVQRSEKENELTTLCVFRRVYVERDEDRQIAALMHLNDPDNYLMRVGSLIFVEIGQLLPQQLLNPAFHTKDVVYPVGYKAVRIYWSFRRLNKRCIYECTISEAEGRPVFNVKCRERDLDEITFSGSSPKEAWGQVLDSIAEMRREAGIIKMFPQYLTGDELFGLTEPAVVKILESLPGLETLTDYRFKYGRNPTFEMPLAINPTGCARTEPRSRTHIKRPHSTQRAGPAAIARSSGPISAAMPSSSALMSSVHAYDPYGLFGKQAVHSKATQYKKMKQEWRSNIYLARSKIAGLGLYAARDLERNTMIIEYIGEIIRPQVAEQREKRYQAANRGIYMFRLDEDRIIDATLKGGLARYVNHCCSPNCVAEAVEVDRDVKIIIFAKTRIARGEELAYDYRFDLEDDQSKIPCMCGAPNCRKWMN